MNLFLSSRVLTNALDNGAFKKNNRICGALLTPLPRKGFRRGNFWLNFDSRDCLLFPREMARWTNKYHQPWSTTFCTVHYACWACVMQSWAIPKLTGRIWGARGRFTFSGEILLDSYYLNSFIVWVSLRYIVNLGFLYHCIPSCFENLIKQQWGFHWLN